MRLHLIPKKIIFDRDEKFNSKFSKEQFAGLEIELEFSTTYHPQIDGKIGRMNRILEDMLRVYVMHQPKEGATILLLVGVIQ